MYETTPTIFAKLIYRLRFALHLWFNVPGIGFWGAFTYPCDITWGSGDPVEDAREEMSEMHA